MRFLLDQDVYDLTGRLLRSWGHDVVSAAQIGMSRAADEALLKKAHEDGCILVTRDRDFGNLVFVRGLGAGVLYLRVLPSTQGAVHTELQCVLNTYSETDLAGAFVVIDATGHRIRWPAG